MEEWPPVERPACGSAVRAVMCNVNGLVLAGSDDPWRGFCHGFEKGADNSGCQGLPSIAG